MILAIKEICIFMLIAQAILFFVPGGTYMKYVRILAGILVILKITEPLLNFFVDEKTGNEMMERIEGIFRETEENSQTLSIEDGSMGIYKGIEKELKKKLVQCENDYTVKTVTLDEKERMVVITVEPKGRGKKKETTDEINIEPVVLGNVRADEEGIEDDNEASEDLKELKAQYGSCIEVDPENIVVRKAEGTDRR